MLDHARHFDVVQHQVGGAQQVGELLLFNAADAVGDGLAVVGAGLVGDLLLEVVEGRAQEAAGAAGRVEHDLASVKARATICTMNSVLARGV